MKICSLSAPKREILSSLLFNREVVLFSFTVDAGKVYPYCSFQQKENSKTRKEKKSKDEQKKVKILRLSDKTTLIKGSSQTNWSVALKET